MLSSVKISDIEKAKTILKIPLTQHLNKEILKQYYKKVVLKEHPDRGGDRKKFREINKSYKFLKEELSKKEYVAKLHIDLKEEYKEPSKIKQKKDMNIEKFNEAFEKNRKVEKGYNDREWKPSVKIPEKVKEKTFDEEFMKIACERDKARDEEIDIYRPPDSLFQMEDDTSVAILGGVENPEYSSQDTDLPYADFWKAYGSYSGPRTSQINKKYNRSLEEIKVQRDDLKMSEKELLGIQRKCIQQEEMENRRKERFFSEIQLLNN